MIRQDNGFAQRLETFTHCPLFLCLLLLLCASAAGAAQQPLTLGIFPYLSAQKLAHLHQPLQQQVARSLNRSVRLLSAPDFKTFIERTREKQYDLILTAPHMGRLAQLQSGYRGLVKSGNISRAIFVTRQESPFVSIADLQGKSLTLPPAKAIIHHMALQTLKDEGLQPGENIQISAVASHNAALQTVLQNKTEVAAFGKPTWDSCPAEQKKQLKVIGMSMEIPGFLLLAQPDISAALQAQTIEGLLQFELTQEGQVYFMASGLKTFEPLDEVTLQTLDPYVQSIFGVSSNTPGD